MTTIDAKYDDTRVAMYEFHHSMVVDRLRTDSFLRAIVSTVEPGDVVVDLGTGTGVLSLFAAMAGARKVYAIEHEPIVDVARQIAVANGVEERIEFVVGRSTEVELPERGDVLVTETIGNAAFDEGILAWVADARSRLLKPNARIIPKQLGLIGALLELPRDYEDMERLSGKLYSFDLSPLRDLAINAMLWDDLSPVSVISKPQHLVEVDLTEAPMELAAGGVLVARRDAVAHAAGLWFEAEIADGIRLSNEPPTQAPSWHQGVVMLDNAVRLSAGEAMRIEVDVGRGGAAWDFRIEKR